MRGKAAVEQRRRGVRFHKIFLVHRRLSKVLNDILISGVLVIFPLEKF
jgi:hypothetical protein